MTRHEFLRIYDTSSSPAQKIKHLTFQGPALVVSRIQFQAAATREREKEKERRDWRCLSLL